MTFRVRRRKEPAIAQVSTTQSAFHSRETMPCRTRNTDVTVSFRASRQQVSARTGVCVCRTPHDERPPLKCATKLQDRREETPNSRDTEQKRSLIVVCRPSRDVQLHRINTVRIHSGGIAFSNMKYMFVAVESERETTNPSCCCLLHFSCPNKKEV